MPLQNEMDLVVLFVSSTRLDLGVQVDVEYMT